MISVPETSCNKEDRSTLWNNLVYCGLYNEYPFQDSPITAPPIKTMTLKGRPLPLISNGPNTSLRLIGFEPTNKIDPLYTIAPWRLITYNQFLEYRVEWSTSSKCKIGFYTVNYLSDPDPILSERRLLVIGKNGPCIFQGRKCGFYFTWVNEFYVITDKDVEVTLNVTCRLPQDFSFPKLNLYKPLSYKIEDGSVFAYETKVTDFSKDITFVPTKKYIKLTAVIRQYLSDTSIVLDFSPVLQRGLVMSTPIPTLELKNLACSFNDDGLYTDVDGNILFPSTGLPSVYTTDGNLLTCPTNLDNGGVNKLRIKCDMVIEGRTEGCVITLWVALGLNRTNSVGKQGKYLSPCGNISLEILPREFEGAFGLPFTIQKPEFRRLITGVKVETLTITYIN